MPSSVTLGKPFTYYFVRALSKQRSSMNFLDIGPGLGTYSKLLRNKLGCASRFTGVEVWEPYVAAHSLNYWYDQVIVGDARQLNWEHLPFFDVTFCGDVLEHMEKNEAARLVTMAARASACVLVSIPLGYHPQGPEFGNPYEIHVSENWQEEDIRALFNDVVGLHKQDFIGVAVVCGDAVERANITVAFGHAEAIVRKYQDAILAVDRHDYGPMLKLFDEIDGTEGWSSGG